MKAPRGNVIYSLGNVGRGRLCSVTGLICGGVSGLRSDLKKAEDGLNRRFRKSTSVDRIHSRPKQYGVRRLTGALRLDVHSPVELIVVVVRLPPEVEPDQQQGEGKEEDEGPQQLPLQHTHTIH